MNGNEREMHPAAIVVDLWRMRCGNCVVALRDELATVCPVCGAPFDSVSSNHVGLAEKLRNRRDAAGIASRDFNIHGAESNSMNAGNASKEQE